MRSTLEDSMAGPDGSGLKVMYVTYAHIPEARTQSQGPT